MNYYLEMALPLVGIVEIPVFLAFGLVAFTFAMLSITALIIAGEIDRKAAENGTA